MCNKLVVNVSYLTEVDAETRTADDDQRFALRRYVTGDRRPQRMQRASLR